MSWRLIIREEVIEDITAASQWYEKQRQWLGDEFIEEVSNTLEVIKSNPHIFQLQTNSVYHGYVNRFPFIIIYEIESRDIVVYAVIRAQRHPRKRYSRTP